METKTLKPQRNAEENLKGQLAVGNWPNQGEGSQEPRSQKSEGKPKAEPASPQRAQRKNLFATDLHGSARILRENR
jgi:hypothetical protein